MQMFSSVIRKKSENRNKNLLNTMQHFIIISTCINDQISPHFPPPHPQKKSCKYFNYLYIIYEKGETTQGEYVTGPKPPGERIP